MKIYIAGPMTGYKDFNFPAFYEAEERFKKFGYIVFNPARMDEELDGFDPTKPITRPELQIHLRQSFARDIECISQCDAIALLPGWEDSVGVDIEFRFAKMIGLKFFDAVTCEEIFPQKNNPNESITLEAHRLVNGDRNKDYGHPGEDFERIRKLWSVLFGHEVKIEHVPLAMILVKTSRLMNKVKRDSFTDIAGYADAGYQAYQYQESRDTV